MSKEKIWQCAKKHKEFCKHMKYFSAGPDEYGRRIYISETMKTVFYQYGLKKKEFVSMFYCPWCGGNLKRASLIKHKSRVADKIKPITAIFILFIVFAAICGFHIFFPLISN